MKIVSYLAIGLSVAGLITAEAAQTDAATPQPSAREKSPPAAKSSASSASARAAKNAMRLDYPKVAPGALQAMLGLEKYVRASGLEKSLLTLVRLRASQINGCAYCLDLHTKEAHDLGESDQKLRTLENWRDAAGYTPRERAALAWTEALTLIAGKPISEEFLQETRKQFREKELVDLTMAIISINGWNRLNISFRSDSQTCPAP